MVSTTRREGKSSWVLKLSGVESVTRLAAISLLISRVPFLCPFLFIFSCEMIKVSSWTWGKFCYVFLLPFFCRKCVRDSIRRRRRCSNGLQQVGCVCYYAGNMRKNVTRTCARRLMDGWMDGLMGVLVPRETRVKQGDEEITGLMNGLRNVVFGG